MEPQDLVDAHMRATINMADYAAANVGEFVSNAEGKKCPECKSAKVTREERQLRSADEPTTIIYECNDCGYVWR